jgi:hypothetical protein
MPIGLMIMAKIILMETFIADIDFLIIKRASFMLEDFNYTISKRI